MTRMLPIALLAVLAACDTAPTIAQSAPEAQALKEGGSAGARAPAFSATDHSGEEVSLDAILEKGPAIVLFYRGHW